MTKKELPVDAIPEVIEFLDSKELLEEFKVKHIKLLKELEILAEDYNQKLQAAEKVVRGKDVTCGPFDRFQEQTKFNVDKLFECIGREEFMKLGGTIKTVAVVEMERKLIEAAIEKNALPKGVADAITTITPKYHVPDKIVVP